MAQWIGYMVSITCPEGMGSYQGEIAAANEEKLTLIKAFHNGFPCDGPIEVKSSDIELLSFIGKNVQEPQENSTVTIAKPVPKRAARSQSVSEANTSKQNLPGRSKPIDIDISKKFDEGLSISYKNNTPNRKGVKGKWSQSWKDEECFGSPLDQKMSADFDFEKNLALFDKQALWNEINAQKPFGPGSASNKKPTKYRHNENVIATQQSSSRPIVVQTKLNEYVTDDGLIVPCISTSLRKKLFEAAERAGLSVERQVEAFGIAASDMVIQLLGGGHRLNPSNAHQLPTVVALCGAHRTGAAALNAARQLASHGVRAVALCPSMTGNAAFDRELALFRLTSNFVASAAHELPSKTDLIICALYQEEEQGGAAPPPSPSLAEWLLRNKAPLLALDPPVRGLPPPLNPKIALLPVLPLAHRPDVKLYLVNLAYPVEVFRMVGVKYTSPFGPKNTMPLHPIE